MKYPSESFQHVPKATSLDSSFPRPLVGLVHLIPHSHSFDFVSNTSHLVIKSFVLLWPHPPLPTTFQHGVSSIMNYCLFNCFTSPTLPKEVTSASQLIRIGEVSRASRGFRGRAHHVSLICLSMLSCNESQHLGDIENAWKLCYVLPSAWNMNGIKPIAGEKSNSERSQQ